MSSQLARNMLVEQRKRMVGSLMTYIEREVYPHLSEPERNNLRSKVLSSSSSYHDVCLDLLKAAVPDGTLGNDEALRALEASVAGLRRDLRTSVTSS